jgi:ankyrin only family protein
MFSAKNIDQLSKNSDNNQINSKNDEEKFNTDSAIDLGYNSTDLSSFQCDSESIEFKAPLGEAPKSIGGILPSEKSQQAPTINIDSGYIDDSEKLSSMLIEKTDDVDVVDKLANLRLNNISKESQPTSDNKFNNQQIKQLLQKRTWKENYQQNNDGNTTLHISVIYGNPEFVSLIINSATHPCLLDIQNDTYQTALHLAVLTGNSQIVRLLVVGGADLTVRDVHGNTALHLASSNGEVDCVRQLLQPLTQEELIQRPKSAKPFRIQDLEQWNYDGEMCVHLASKYNHLDVLRLLVKFGANVNAREGKSGWTPLHFAVENNNQIMANYILECPQINVEAETYGGLTAYQLAVLMENDNLLQDLLKGGAEPLSPPPDSESDDDNDDDDYMMDQYILQNYNPELQKMNVVN